MIKNIFVYLKMLILNNYSKIWIKRFVLLFIFLMFSCIPCSNYYWQSIISSIGMTFLCWLMTTFSWIRDRIGEIFNNMIKNHDKIRYKGREEYTIFGKNKLQGALLPLPVKEVKEFSGKASYYSTGAILFVKLYDEDEIKQERMQKSLCKIISFPDVLPDLKNQSFNTQQLKDYISNLEDIRMRPGILDDVVKKIVHYKQDELKIRYFIWWKNCDLKKEAEKFYDKLCRIKDGKFKLEWNFASPFVNEIDFRYIKNYDKECMSELAFVKEFCEVDLR